jgi:hypothetical protein
VVWPIDVVSVIGRNWHVRSEDEVRSDDGRHRLLRREGRWTAFEASGPPQNPASEPVWIAVEFWHSGTLASSLDSFDRTFGPVTD